MTSTTDLIRARMQEHRDEVEAIKGRTAVLRVERDALLQQREEIDAQIEAKTEEIRAHQPEMDEQKRGIAACASALGGKRLSDAKQAE